jgi:hypothetical protein
LIDVVIEFLRVTPKASTGMILVYQRWASAGCLPQRQHDNPVCRKAIVTPAARPDLALSFGMFFAVQQSTRSSRLDSLSNGVRENKQKTLQG